MKDGIPHKEDTYAAIKNEAYEEFLMTWESAYDVMLNERKQEVK